MSACLVPVFQNEQYSTAQVEIERDRMSRVGFFIIMSIRTTSYKSRNNSQTFVDTKTLLQYQRLLVIDITLENKTTFNKFKLLEKVHEC